MAKNGFYGDLSDLKVYQSMIDDYFEDFQKKKDEEKALQAKLDKRFLKSQTYKQNLKENALSRISEYHVNNYYEFCSDSVHGLQDELNEIPLTVKQRESIQLKFDEIKHLLGL